MSSSDIYEVKESPWTKKQEPSRPSSRRQRRPIESFDDAVNKDVSATHRRRRNNSGIRRFRHLMKKPGYSKKFWTIVLSIFGFVIGSLLIWDLFFRYPRESSSYEPESVRIEIK